jgi:hypothetical protein
VVCTCASDSRYCTSKSVRRSQRIPGTHVGPCDFSQALSDAVGVPAARAAAQDAADASDAVGMDDS